MCGIIVIAMSHSAPNLVVLGGLGPCLSHPGPLRGAPDTPRYLAR